MEQFCSGDMHIADSSNLIEPNMDDSGHLSEDVGWSKGRGPVIQRFVFHLEEGNKSQDNPEIRENLTG
jgi:hypothetical protein